MGITRKKIGAQAGGLGAAALLAGGIMIGAAPVANASSNDFQTPNNGGQEWVVTEGDSLTPEQAERVVRVAGACAVTAIPGAIYGGPAGYTATLAACGLSQVILQG